MKKIMVNLVRFGGAEMTIRTLELIQYFLREARTHIDQSGDSHSQGVVSYFLAMHEATQ